jgi:hypothetical protein
MGLYSYLTDDQLDAEIEAFRQARRDVMVPGAGGVGTVKRVTDADRTIEYTSANLRDLDYELERLLREKDRRSNRGCGRAIGVEFD